MKKKWILIALAILGIVVWFWVMAASAHSDCSVGPIWQTRGLCLGRDLAEMSVFVVYFAAWTWLGGVVAKGKGRNPIIGRILGFTLQFMGCLFMMMWEPRRDNTGRMIGWDEYKHFTAEEREAAIRSARTPLSPEIWKMRIKILAIAIFVTLLMVMVFEVLKVLVK